MGKYLVVGGDGLIGSELAKHLRENRCAVTTTTRRQAQNRQDQIYFDMLSNKHLDVNGIDCSFLCAGVTSIAQCESDPELTYKVNVDATVNVAKQLHASGSRIVFISSNTVFDGNDFTPDETATCKYTTEYGRQKMIAERELLALGCGVVVIRITKVVSLRSELIAKIVSKLKSNNVFEVYRDLMISPMSISYLCQSIYTIANSGHDGIFHLSGEDSISYAQMSSLLADYIGASQKLVIPTDAISVLFKPKYASLGMQRTASLLNIKPEKMDHFLSNLFINR